MSLEFKTMELWIIIAIFAGLMSNVSNFMARQILKDEKDALIGALFLEITKVIIFAIASIFDHQFILSTKNLIILTLIVITEPFAIYLYMKMHELNHLSISSIITRTRMIWATILAFIFLGETLHLGSYLGIIILFLGLSVVVAPHKIFVDKGIKIASIFSLEVAVFSIMVKSISNEVSLPLIFLASALPASFIFYIKVRERKISVISFARNKFKSKLIFGLSNYTAFWGSLIAIKLGSVSIATAIYQGMIIFGVLAGILFLNERKDVKRKIIGSAITLVGIILVSVS